jgi:hypothetical protein
MLKRKENFINIKSIQSIVNLVLLFAIAFMFLKVISYYVSQFSPESVEMFNKLEQDEHGRYILPAILTCTFFLAVLIVILCKLCKLIYSFWINIKATIIDEVDGVEEEHNTISVYKIKSRNEGERWTQN